MARTKGSDELYRLIHALTTEEKGYFKKFAKRHTPKGNKQLELFDAINRQKEFEEETLKKKFNGYADMKVYLFETILNSLYLSDKETGIEGELLRSWFHMRYLNKKGLKDKAAQLNKQVITKARSAEVFWLENEFLRMQNDMEKHGWEMAERAELNRKFFEELAQAKQKQNERDVYYELERKLLEFNYTKTFNTKFNRKEFDKQVPLSALKKPGKMLTVRAEKMRLSALSMYYSVTRETKENVNAAVETYELEKRLWKEKHPLARWSHYVGAIRALMVAYLYSNQPELVFVLNEEMRSLKGEMKVQNAENEFCYFTYQMYAYWHCARHAEGEAFVKNGFPKKLITEYGERFYPYVLEIYRYKVLFEISNKNYKQVFISMADFEAQGIKKDAPVYYKSCQLAQILLQVELKEYQLLPSMVDSAIKRLELTPAETTLLKAVKKLTAVNRVQVLKKLWKELPTEFPGKVVLFNAIVGTSWLEAMVTGKPLEKIMKDNQDY